LIYSGRSEAAMPQTPRRRTRATLCVIALSTTVGAARADAAVSGAPAYASAETCKSCHRTIHLYWSESEHGRSAVKPSFVTALNSAVAAGSDREGVRRGCVSCHAPTTIVTGDIDLKQSLAREGVTCDFCHTVADVDLGRHDQPFDLKPGPVKRGPLEYAKSPHHETAYSALHRASPLLCAGCHEYTNAQGVAVLSTYSEWTGGPYPARGQTCQECHMPLVPGATVKEALDPTQRRINLHRIVGGSAATRVSGGLELRLQSVDIGAASADVQVLVTNTSVGHAAPGGLSTKSLVLAVGVDTGSGELASRQERVYRRELLDAAGHPLATVQDLFLKSASVGQDTRLKQKEARAERFTVPLPESWKAIVARIEYRDASDPKQPRSTLIAEQRRDRGR
jgi:cytochrome c554/c'-like protein